MINGVVSLLQVLVSDLIDDVLVQFVMLVSVLQIFFVIVSVLVDFFVELKIYDIFFQLLDQVFVQVQ